MSPLRGSLHGVIIFYYCNVIPSGLWFVTAETRMNVTPSGLVSLGQLFSRNISPLRDCGV